MATQTTVDEQRELLDDFRDEVPAGCKLLYESLVLIDQNHPVDPRDVKEDAKAVFEDCYLLVGPHSYKINTWKVLGWFKLTANTFRDKPEFLDVFREWLQKPNGSSKIETVEEKKRNGVTYFFPKGFPRHYYHFVVEIKFRQIFP